MNDEQPKEHPRQKELEELIESNNRLLQQLAREGVQVEQKSIASGRHSFFIEHTIASLPADERYAFEIAWQEQVQKSLTNTGREARRQRLMAGGHKPKGSSGPGIILPGTNGAARG